MISVIQEDEDGSSSSYWEFVGIGFETSLLLARNGFFTYATMRNLGKSNKIIELKQKEKLPLEVLKLDVADDKSVKEAIEKTSFHQSTSHVYQNVVAKAVFDREEIKQNLIDQLTNAVRWTQSVQAMIADGATKFTEVGPGKVLQGLITKIDKTVEVDGYN